MENESPVWIGLVDGRTIEFWLTEEEYNRITNQHLQYMKTRNPLASWFQGDNGETVDLMNVCYITVGDEEEIEE